MKFRLFLLLGTSANVGLLLLSTKGILTVSLPVMQPVLRQAIYRKDGSSRIKTTPKISNPDQNKNSDGSGPISLLTFGRSGMKGPSGRKPQGLDNTITAAVTVVNTNFEGSVTRLVSEDRSSHNTGTEHVEP